MSFPAKEVIKNRKSVRSFDGKPLSEEDKAALWQYLKGLTAPFGVKVEFRLLDAGENGLSSPVIIGARTYFAAKAEKTGHFELGLGYSFEKVCLYAASRGMGTVMLAASLNREAFEKALDVKENEVMPVASPVGYPAAKRSIRESLMRKGLKADDRVPFERLFFRDGFDRPLRKEDAGDLAGALEAVRRAPSAANRQPWRAVITESGVHFYEQKSIKDSPLGDVQKVDMGIALCHFDLSLEEDGISGSFEFEDPELAVPGNTYYIVSWKRAE